jgi:putative transposase
VHTYAYALLPNHFHILLKIKDEQTLPTKVWSLQRNNIYQPFSNCFNAYAKAINVAYHRVSSLFEDRFERIQVTSDDYFTRLIYYIHVNPQKHGYVKDFRDYPHTSYHSLLSDQPTGLAREAVLDWLGGRENFLKAHDLLYQEWSPDSKWLGLDDA